MPFGLGVATGGWDDADNVVSGDDLRIMFQQIESVNSSPTTVAVLTHHRYKFEEYEKALGQVGYTDATSLTWCKEGHNAVGHNKRYVFSTEFMQLLWKPDIESCPSFLSPNPLERHNFIIGPAQHTKFKSLKTSKPVNIHEKPPWLMKELCKRHVTPGGRVLIIGGGAGGEVVGAMRAGMDVICVEKDEVQFHDLLSRVVSEAKSMFAKVATSEKPLEDVQYDDEEGDGDEDDKEAEGEGEVEAPPYEALEKGEILGPCVVCKEDLDSTEAVECPLCVSMFHGEKCGEEPTQDESSIISTMLKFDAPDKICAHFCPKLLEIAIEYRKIEEEE
jgi:hypothetical protein